MTDRPDVLVLGAGITGLAAAHTLHGAGVSVTVLEGSQTAGGSIRTVRSQGFVVEAGPNSLMTSPETDALRDELGLGGVEVNADPKAPRYIVRGGRPIALRPGPGAVFAPILSWPAKLRAALEPFVPGGSGAEESIHSFFMRRFGEEVSVYLAGPFVSGVWAGDPELLSLQASFTKLAEAEKRGGSVIRGLLKMDREAKKAGRPRQPRRSTLYREGLDALPRALATALGGRLILGAPVVDLRREGSRWVAETAAGARYEAPLALTALPAGSTARLLRSTAPTAVSELSGIDYVPVVTLTLAWPHAAFPSVPRGFGTLIPRREGFRILGALYVSDLFPGRAPEGWSALTCFLGGAFDRAALDAPDDVLVTTARNELGRLLGVSGDPIVVQLTRWPRAIPQYHMGHLDRVYRIDTALALFPGLKTIGSWRGGISLADCITHGREAGRELAAELGKSA